MPFKDIASSDTLLMRELPAADDAAARTALRRLQEVGMHVIAPLDAIRTRPLDHAIPLVPLDQVSPLERPSDFKLLANCERCAPHATRACMRRHQHRAPQCCAESSCQRLCTARYACRYAVTIDGTESDEQLAALAVLDPIVALLNTAASESRLHASRRVFDTLKRAGVETPVIHHREFAGAPERDEIVITTGS
jgi:(E)-4-hydroxy-3-methylbut-2-enyl-diphosphate synthase